jgi:hypothetical protein
MKKIKKLIEIARGIIQLIILGKQIRDELKKGKK